MQPAAGVRNIVNPPKKLPFWNSLRENRSYYSFKNALAGGVVLPAMQAGIDLCRQCRTGQSNMTGAKSIAL
jgi:hypothetical protein